MSLTPDLSGMPGQHANQLVEVRGAKVGPNKACSSLRQGAENFETSMRYYG